MSDEETKESVEQPLIEDSEIADQPEVLPEEGGADEETETEEPTSEEEPMVEVNGEQIPISELKQGYMRQSDYTKKTQELAAKKRDVQVPKQELTEEQKQVQAFIKENNLMTTAQFNQLQADNNALAELRTSGMSPTQEKTVKALSKSTEMTSAGVPYYQATMKEIYDDVFGGDSEAPKVVRKKVVGMQPKTGARDTGGLTREKIANMTAAEYEKNREAIAAAMMSGNLK